MTRRYALAVLTFAGACGKARSDTQIQAGANSTARSAATEVPALPAPSAPAATGRSWRGTYKSLASELYIPADWKSVHWNVKESAAGIGEGPIAITVDAVNRRVIGTLEGPLGPAILRGFAADGKLTATIARKDPADQGFTGTLVGSLGDGGAEGTMSASPAEANAVRTATFMLSPDGVQAPR